MTIPPPASPDEAPVASGLAQQWAQLVAGLGSLHQRLRRELRDAWVGMSALLEEQARSGQAAPIGAHGLADYAEARAVVGRTVLLDPLARWERLRPLQRAQLAIESYHRGVDDLVRRLPSGVPADGPGVIAVAAPAAVGLAARVAGWRRATWELPLEAVVAAALRRIERHQATIESRCLLAMGRAEQQLRRAWDEVRNTLDHAVAGRAPDVTEPATSLAELEREVTVALDDLDAWLVQAPASVGGELLAAAAWRRRPKAPPPNAPRATHFEHWAMQLAHLETELRFERSLEAIERRVLAAAERSCAAAEVERGRLLAAIADFIGWLDGRLRAGQPGGAAPDVFTAVVPAASRMAELAAGVRGALDFLPDEVQLVRRLEPEPRRRPSVKAIAPDRMATEAFARVGTPRIEVVFEGVQADHVTLVREIERARQVVQFASESEGETDDAAVARDALGNARSLLDVDRSATPLALTSERAEVARALAAAFIENRLLLTRTRLGAFAHLGRMGLRQALGTGGAAAAVALTAVARTLVREGAALGRRFLVAIGWTPDDATDSEDVIRRPYLPREFTLDPRERDLPAIYRRLFRFEAVSDPRFLVGRDREMHAIAEARELWEAERPVAVLVVGDRGSGKTSLINCAIAKPLAGLDVVRAEFRERVASAEGVRAFLTKVLELDAPDDIEPTLSMGRRVLILEETERTFLREVGGLAGVRELQRLIAATCHNTLWILVTNQHAFRLLDAAVKLGSGFSHRLDAASASAEAVREAIMVRHNLSGLRLRFVAPPPPRPWVARLQRLAGSEPDPERLFFAGLGRESAGVFRTAFELWLGQIDSVQAGTLIMKPMSRPDINAVIEQLDQDDLFALLAIMQHGSLTAEEHAAVFRWTPAASGAQLDDLLAREIIEPEPTRPGFRVRPGALRVAREALHRRNLA